MPGRQANPGDYRYGFNGKEEDVEGMGGGGNTYDYGFRIYNPQIAKFLSVDPLFKTYPWYSSYQYAGNSPVAFIDLDGLERVLAISFDGVGPGGTNYRIGNLRRLNDQDISSMIITDNPASQIANAFIEASNSDENGIGFVAIFGHGIPNNLWGNGSQHMDADDLGELEQAIKDGKVSFTENAIVYIGNCNAGTDDGSGGNFAQRLANITGATVIAGATDDYGEWEHRGSVGVNDEKNGNMKYEMWFPKLDAFKAFEENQEPVSLDAIVDLKILLERTKDTDASDLKIKPLNLEKLF